MNKAGSSIRDVAVLICECDRKLPQRLDFARLTKTIGGLDTVAAVTRCSQLCDPGKCGEAIRAAAKKGGKRFVAAGCSIQSMGTGLAESFAHSRVPDGLWWPVNIKDQSAGKVTKPAATARVIDSLTSAVNRMTFASPIGTTSRTLCQDVVVIGGGVTAMQAAISLSAMGHRVSLVHSGSDLGGAALAAPELHGYMGDNPGDAEQQVHQSLVQLKEQLNASPGVTVISGSTLGCVEGEYGDFVVRTISGGGQQLIRAGAIVLACGPDFRPAGNPLGVPESASVITMPQMLEMMRTGKPPKSVAILMDLADQQSRGVSAQVLSVAERLAAQPASQVVVFCQHVRVAATGMENLYRRARAAGVRFTRYDVLALSLSANSKVALSTEDRVVGAGLEEEFDLVVLADLKPGNQAASPAGLVPGLRTSRDASLQYDNVWLLPVATNRQGIFVAGGARGGSDYREALTDGLAAAGQAHALLSGRRVRIPADAAVVDPEKCVMCLTCKRVCPHGAISVDDEKKAASVSTVACRRCGTCAAECPALAISLPRFTDSQVNADVGAKPGITIFACENSALQAAETAAGQGYQAEVRLVRVPCAGRVDPRHILNALEQGAAKVMVLGCHPENCRYLTGSTRASKRLQRLRDTLAKAGFDSNRIVFGGIAALEPARFRKYVHEIESTVQTGTTP